MHTLTRFFLGVFLLFLSLSFASGQAKFIPNKGQWSDISQYRSDISGGRIFLCKNEIRYNFVDSRDFKPLHQDPFLQNFIIHGQAVFLQWQNANPSPKIIPKNEYPEYYNFFIGHHENEWQSGLHAYSDLTYENLYPGINLHINADGNDLKYTYVVSPGAKAAAIRIIINGANDVFINGEDLHITTNLGEITEKSPFVYQLSGDEKVPVKCNFKLNGNKLSFEFPNGYDQSKILVIDPVVIFATYSGSKADNFGFTATYDSIGNGYSGGDVFGAGFPTTSGAFQYKYAGGRDFNTSTQELDVLGFFARDVGILKYAPDGKSLIYATYLGGKNANEQPHSMVVDRDNNLVVFGTTGSSDFPVTKKAYDTSFNGYSDIFVSRFSADGKKLLSSTYIGGSGYDGLNGLDAYTVNSKTGNISFTGQGKLGYNYGDQFRGEVIVDKNKNVYVATTTLSSNFPVTSGSYQTSFGGGVQDGCVFKMDSSLGKLIWSSFLGGNKEDAAFSIQLDRNNNLFVCGGTASPYFFPKGSSSQNYLAGGIDAYLCHLKNDGSTILSATYLGTNKYDQAFFVQLDNSENVYLYGQTESNSFLIWKAKYFNAKSCNFITKFNYTLDTILFSTVFGSGKGKPDISPTAFLVDKCEKIYISGWGGALWPSLSPMTQMYGMPLTSDAYQKTTDSADFYVAVFERNMDTLLYSSYFGGPISEEHVDGGTSRFDKNGIMYQSVCGGCQTDPSPKPHSDFPTTSGAWSRSNNSPNCNNLLFKVDLKIPTLKAGFIAPQFGCLNVTLHFTNTSLKAKSYTWDFGDGSPVSTLDTPKHFYKTPGNYTIKLVAYNPTSCQVYDTFTSKVTIYKNAKANFNVIKDTCGLTIKFLQTGESNTNSWAFGDGNYSHAYNGIHNYAVPGKYKVTLLVDSGTSCVDTFRKTVSVTGLKADFKTGFQECTPELIQFTNLSTGALKFRKWYLPYASTDTSKNPTFNFLKTGTYKVSLVVKDSFGCKDSITKTITIQSKPKSIFTVKVDSCSLLANFKSLSTNAKNVHWLFGDGGFSDLDSPSHAYPKDTTYKVLLIADPGLPCADTSSRLITFTPAKAAYGFTIDTCSGVVHFTDKSTNEKSRLWKFTTTDSSILQNPDFSFTNKGTYHVKLTVKSSSGCPDSFLQTILITHDGNREFHIPNVFTPNGDPFNNKFVVKGLSPCYTSEMWIYNRWGEEVFHAKGSDLTWDGYVNHVLVAEGVYYYVFKGHLEGTLTGTVSVLYK